MAVSWDMLVVLAVPLGVADAADLATAAYVPPGIGCRLATIPEVRALNIPGRILSVRRKRISMAFLDSATLARKAQHQVFELTYRSREGHR